MDSVVDLLGKRSIGHPVIIALGGRGDISQVFLSVEGHIAHVPRGLVAAVDKLLKLYFVMNMEYPANCKHVLLFLQRCAFGLSDGEALCRSVTDLSLFIRQKKIVH